MDDLLKEEDPDISLSGLVVSCRPGRGIDRAREQAIGLCLLKGMDVIYRAGEAEQMISYTELVSVLNAQGQLFIGS